MKDVSMKKQTGTFSKKLDEYIHTKQFRWLRFLILLLGFIVTGCICFLAGFFLNRDDNMIYKSNINAITNQIQNTEPPVTTAPETTTITTTTELTTVTTAKPTVNGVLLNSRLKENLPDATAEYAYSNACNFENRNSIGDVNIPLTKKSFTISYDGVITATLDSSLITLSVDNDAKTVTVIIPEAYIISHEIDESSFVISGKNDNIFNPISNSDYTDICLSNNSKMEEKAISNGLYDKVYENAESEISDFLYEDELIAESYSINFIISRI